MNSALATAVGKRLRDMRYDARLSQAEVAARTCIHRPIIGRIERGVHLPSIEACAAYAGACGGSLQDVLQVVDEWARITLTRAQ